jgi:transposase
MIERFHGIDRHKRFSTISVVNRSGAEIRLIGVCRNLRAYIETLGSQDAVVLEASSGAFWWADQVEFQGAQCYILNPYRFKIIKDSWNKTDKRDARNMVRALWVTLVTGEFGIPTVYKPQPIIRELRKLFGQYVLVNRQLTMHKNAIQAVMVENGIVLSEVEKRSLFSRRKNESILKELLISKASRTIIQISLELLWKLKGLKEAIRQQILLTGEPLKEQVELLLTIRGISPLTSLAFLADVGNIHRFSSVRKMNAYLGLVPRMKDSGGKTYAGHITRESRKLTRTILTQSLVQLTEASHHFSSYYEELKIRRGAGRARIALIRKVCSTMRRMLLNEEQFRSISLELFQRKLNVYEREVEKIKEQKRTA